MFKKRETLTQNIAYFALMAGINVIFVLLTALFPPLMFLLIFFLPLANTIVTVFCKKRYYPIYAVVTIGLCLLATFGIYIFDTFFYVIPSLITGFIFGVLIEKKINGIHILVATNFVQYLFTVLTFIILNSIFPELHFVDNFMNMLGLTNFAFKPVFICVFSLLLAFIQNLFTYFVLKIEIAKLGLEINTQSCNLHLTSILVFLGVILMVIGYFYSPILCYSSFLIILPYGVYLASVILGKMKALNFIEIGLILLISIFSFALLFQLTKRPLSIITFTITYVLLIIVSELNNTLLKR